MYQTYKVTAWTATGRKVEDRFYSRNETSAKRDFLECYRHENYTRITAEHVEQ